MVTWVLDLAEGAEYGVFTAEDGSNAVVKVTRGPLGLQVEPVELADNYGAALTRAEYLNETA
jgi:hypothetical protein